MSTRKRTKAPTLNTLPENDATTGLYPRGERCAGWSCFQEQEDDRTVGVAQDEGAEFEDVIGWRLDDVVQKIRGPKGSIVWLSVLASEKE